MEKYSGGLDQLEIMYAMFMLSLRTEPRPGKVAFHCGVLCDTHNESTSDGSGRMVLPVT